MRHRLRVIRARGLAWIGFLRLTLAIARRQVDEVWVGDSNAVMFVMDRFPALGIGTTDGRRWAWHLGPRLMFSMARDGFPRGLHRMLRVLGRIPGTRQVTWFFDFGEIDIRCHLAARLNKQPELPFVDIYVERIQGLVAEFGGTHGVIVVPVPPAVDAFTHEDFPVVGTLEERLAAHRLMRRRMIEATEVSRPGPRIMALDLTERLSDTSGYYRPELAGDGVHPNAAGRTEARREVARLLEQL